MKKKSTLALEQTAAQKLVVWWRENRDLALCITLSTTTTTIEAATMELSKTRTSKYKIAKANQRLLLVRPFNEEKIKYDGC